MQSDQILDLLNQIGATPGKLDKEALLREADCPELRRVLTAALDPLITYGIARLPYRTATVDNAEGMGAQFTDSTWLIIDQMANRQLTGDAMRSAVEFELNTLSPKSADLLGRILTKDLKAGFGDNTTNKAIPGLIREFPYMRCSLPKGDRLNQINWLEGVISQEKADGMFFNVNHVTGGLVMLFSRAGTMFPTEPFGALIDQIRAVVPSDYQAHGEMLVKKGGKILPREEGNGILNSVAQGGAFADDEVPVLMLWDLVPLQFVVPKGKYLTGYLARVTQLVSQLKARPQSQISVIPTRIVKSKEEAYAHYRELLAQGKEGTIIKLRGAIWRDGTSTEQFKLKLEADVDLKMVGLNPGEGKNAKTFGSVRCVSACGQLEVNVSGFKDAQRMDIFQNWDSYYKDGVMTVRGNSIMKPSDSNPLHSLFLPRCVEIRSDKTEADSLQRIFDQFDAAVKAA